MSTQPITRDELELIYAESAAALDDLDFARWLSFFADACSYTLTSKENVDRGWPIALMSCETRGMMMDRINAILTTQFFAPRTQRRVQSGVFITSVEGDITRSRGTFAVFETRGGEHTVVFAAGRFIDEIIRENGNPRFLKRTCILDGALIPNSLPYPL